MFPQIFGKYVLERELASGGMARVYLATLRGAVGFEKRLVVKQIRPELASDPAFVRRFVEEAKTAVELSHANIVPVYELGVEQGVYYIAMELCAGLTLSDVLADAGKLSAEEGAYLGSEICRALDYAHRRAGIVHRDVTPRNVLIDEEGAVRLIDFGIAAPVTVANGAHPEVFGSPGHMPPEQLAGGALTPAADVFAVAVLLVEVWTGRPPFRRSSSRESEKALAVPVPSLADTDPALAPLAEHVARGLELDPGKRLAQAELFARPLRDFLRPLDSVDVARKLGERVRRAEQRAERALARGLPATPSSRPTSDRPSQPYTAGAPTRTFAAREEVIEWTRRLDSTPPPEPTEDDPSTRPLLSPPPDEPSTGVLVPAEHAEAPPPVELGAPRELLQEPPLRPTARERSVGVRTIAAAAALAVLMVGALELARPREPARSAPIQSGVAARVPARELVAAPASAASAAPVAAASLAPSAASSVSAPVASASLRLTADPPARVSVTGTGLSRSFETPVRELKLPAGSYAVTFRSAIYAAPLATRVLLTAGAQRSVHADFRDAEPRVSVR